MYSERPAIFEYNIAPLKNLLKVHLTSIIIRALCPKEDSASPGSGVTNGISGLTEFRPLEEAIT